MNTRSSMERPFAITGRMVLIGIVAFFGIVFAVNGTFVYFALESWPGLTTRHAYNEGVEYNQVLAAAEAQAARGWKAEMSHGEAGDNTALQIAMSGHDRRPLSGLQVRLEIVRPVGGDSIRYVDLSEAEAGIYRAGVPRLGPGRWQVGLVATAPGEADFHLRYEIVVRP